MKLPLHEFAQATADANGRAVTETGPQKFGESWDITLMNINTNSASQSQLRVYRGVESDTAQVLSTYSGNSDTAGGGSTITLQSGEKLVFVWSNADPGSICTARIEGDLNSRRR